ncbi:uncharacterized protein G2W53_014626 [Senna tora]|uniref:Uncharacterized protein n=1 Tax=Senna tora TaxID=362788 RepID=A0A834WTV8_9FABA|nr:uncharacterized protein G2W53_014626 [Senna tora]
MEELSEDGDCGDCDRSRELGVKTESSVWSSERDCS